VKPQSDQIVLVVRCPDQIGIVAAISSYLANNDASIVEASQFNDATDNQFYLRASFRQNGTKMPPIGALRTGFQRVAAPFKMSWNMYDERTKPRVLIAVSKFGHCLYDLLHRWRSGLLPVDLVGVVSNHDDMRSFVEWSGIPFYQFPMSAGKDAQERSMINVIAQEKVDLVVLARYMQILSPEMCEVLSGRCINIHHSFLPSFKGAKPYHQAFTKGVKIIGATAHYVTASLDEGPIIEQDIQRVSHSHQPEQLVEMGRDVECRVLARAVTWHVEHRVIIAGSKTIVFS